MTQSNILFSNFWEKVKTNLTLFVEWEVTDETKQISLELLNKFNGSGEYTGDFDKLLNDLVYMYKNDQNLREVFGYDAKETEILLSHLDKNEQKIIDLTNTKLEGKINEANQVWRVAKEADFISEEANVENALQSMQSMTKPTALDVDKLSDYGEKIGGAKKDTYRRLENISENDIMSQPLSKSFPEPDYVKLVADGTISEKGALLLKFFYDKIPTKPRNKYKLQRWVGTVQNAIEVLMSLITNSKDLDYTEKLASGLSKYLADEYLLFVSIMLGLGFPQKNVNLGNFTIRKFENFSKKNYETGEYENVPVRFTIVSGYSIVKDFPTMEEAIQGLGAIINQVKEKPSGKKGTKFSAYQDSKTKDFFIGKKGSLGVVRLMEGFKTQKEVLTYLKENQTKLQSIWDAMTAPVKERPEINKERVGVDWRNNENISAEKLSQKFGFRGIEFGNYVNNKERQDHVNNAFDSLMDLATAVGISTEDLALGGQLGLAFGARGSGNASAHYEPIKTVINLTKKNGAGSLAHEYWHALDNYFSKMRGDSIGFITSKPKPLYLSKSNVEGSRDPKDFLDQRVNHELLNAFKGIMDAISKTELVNRSQRLDRTKGSLYWSTPFEMSARCFESFIISKLGETGNQNEYLANFSDIGSWVSQGNMDIENTYPYPLKDEELEINQAFEQFFVVLEETQHLKQK